MQVTKTIKSATQVNLNVAVSAAEMEPVKKHVLNHFVDKVKVPGFRAGKVPLALVEKHVDQRAMLDEFLEHAINEFYRRAVNQEKLRVVAPPKAEIKKFVPFTQLVFEAAVSVLGSMKLADYKKIKLAKTPVSISAKEVNDVLESLSQRMGERVELARAAKDGDELIIDFKGTDSKGQPISGADGQDYPLILGSKAFIPGFEEHLVGLKAGGEEEFTITFPKDYGVAALGGKKVTFKVKVKKVQEVKSSKLDNASVAKVGPFKTLAELKADIKKQLASEKQQKADRSYENELVKKITDKSSVEIPGSLIDEQVARMEEEEKRNLVYRGQTWQEHLKAEGISEEEHRKRHRPDAEARVKAGLVLSEVADKENIMVTPEELDIKLQELKSQYQDPAMLTELNKPENRQEIAARILTEKTVDKLVQYASAAK